METTQKSPTLSNFGESEREAVGVVRGKKDIKKLSKQEQAHQGNYTNIETEVKNMLADKLEAISTDLEEIQGSLTGVRNIIAKRAISRVLNDLDDVY
ncbi:hypothetical protein LAJ55_10565, partial [Streptococcus pneumoniae]|nr:hypothetical protein [Streptococcus pneumoniae]